VKEKLLQMLGLAMRARKLISGEDSVIQAVRSGKAKLVLLATDASANTVKKVTDKCRYYAVSCHTVCNRYELGRAIGKEGRVVLAVTDENFADSIRRLLTPNP